MGDKSEAAWNGTKCEAAVGVDMSGHAPRVIYCEGLGKLRPNEREWKFPDTLAFCDTHAYLATPRDTWTEAQRG